MYATRKFRTIHIHINNTQKYIISNNTRWRSWLRHCATTRKVTGSIPDDNPTSCTMALESTQPLREMSTRNICPRGGLWWVVDKAAGAQGWQTTPSGSDCLEIWEPQPSRTLTAVFYLFLKWDLCQVDSISIYLFIYLAGCTMFPHLPAPI